ncbi:MAG: GntR family transcriptional regulator [Acetobacteraceae bacterium]|nr:GntR family transcriptional regulator [Acetobacteraceae bacterium]
MLVRAGSANNAAAGFEGSSFRLPAVIGQELARTLSDRIIFLELQPGTHLMEDVLCAEYNVSRSPVREAFRALESDGLVMRLARRGVRVTPMGRRDLQEVYACRVVLEGLAAREAAQHATESDLAGMRTLLASMAQALEGEHVRAFFDSNVAFTSAIHAASSNRTLMRIAAGIEKQALRYRYVAHSHTRKMLEASYQGHSEVFEAIAQRKPDIAERCGQASIQRAEAVILQVIDTLWPEGQ